VLTKEIFKHFQQKVALLIWRNVEEIGHF